MNFSKITFITTLYLFCTINSFAYRYTVKHSNKSTYNIDSRRISTPITDIIQNYDGLIYVCNNSAIFEFDGISWRNIANSKNPTLTRFKNEIITLNNNDINFIYKDKNKQSRVSPLWSRKHLKNIDPTDIKQMTGYKNGLLIRTSKRISVINEGRKIINIIDSKEDNLNIHPTATGIFISNSNIVYKLNDYKLIKYGKTSKQIKSIITTGESVVAILINNHAEPLNNNTTLAESVNNILTTEGFITSISLTDTLAAIATNRSIYVINQKGDIVHNKTEIDNIKLNNINKLYADLNNKLWIINGSYIHITDMFDPFREIYSGNNQEELKSITNYYNDRIIYKNNKLISVKGSPKILYQHNRIITSLNSVNKKLIFSDSNTVYSLNNNKEEVIYKSTTNRVKSLIVYNKSVIINDGRNYVIVNPEQKSSSSTISHNKDITKLVVINDTIWGTTKDNIVTYVGLSKGKIKTVDTKNSMPVVVINNNNKPLFIIDEYQYRYSSSTNSLTGKSSTKNRDIIIKERTDLKGNKWQLKYHPQTLKLNLNINWLAKDQSTSISAINNDEIIDLKKSQDIVFVITKDAVWEFNCRLYIAHKYVNPPNIRQIIVNDSIVGYGSNQNDFFNESFVKKILNKNYRFKTKEISFWSSSGNYPGSAIRHIYKLEHKGHTKTLSETSNRLTLNGLTPGNYVLSVQSSDIYGNISDPTEYYFGIATHPFWSTLAKIVYGILIVILIINIRNWYLLKIAEEKVRLSHAIGERTEELIKEKERFDNLITRVLPSETANEIAFKGKASAQRFKRVTVLFSDIQGFTRITDEMHPEQLIDELDQFFLHFDEVIDKYNIEKIKTIGDAYMCAGGIPTKNNTNPIEVVMAAIEMQNYMKYMQTNSAKKKIWDIRIGIDTGPVIAGVIGRKKISYDIWGTTVNTASRMESSGEPNKINITSNTYMLIRNYFTCTYRGKMPVKNKGEIDMYFVDGIKPELSVDGLGIEPNEDFRIQLQILRLTDLEDFILNKLEKGLPKNLYYHNVKHTIDVYTQVELIGRQEGLSNKELLVLRTAGLMHDVGHLIDYDEHEEMGVKLAKEILVKYKYDNEQIEQVCKLIMATKMPPEPKTLMEKIICDADLDYLGRSDFIPVSNTLFRELSERGKITDIKEWDMLQLKFIENHQYFTETARALREVNKQNQLEKIRKITEEL
jgi:class 3 adenylate cyclase